MLSTVLDLLLLYLCVGGSLFFVDLAFTPVAEFAGLWRYARSRAAPVLAVVGIGLATLLALARWSLMWPMIVAPTVRRWRRR